MLKDDNFDYEGLYSRVLKSGRYSQEQQDAFALAVRAAYEEMDEWLLASRAQAMHMCQAFLKHFAGTPEERGFVFTLNQDLLIERSYAGDTLPTLPGISTLPWPADKLTLRLTNWAQEHWAHLPTESELPKARDHLHRNRQERPVYVKLHGSIGWKGTRRASAMVIGNAKRDSIAKEPLLKWYLSLFREVLGQSERNLVVIGYGFGDEHINDVIVDAVKKSRLKLYIVSPNDPAEVRKKMWMPVHAMGAMPKPVHRGEELWNALHGYYQAKVTDFYGGNNLRPSVIGEKFFRQLGLM